MAARTRKPAAEPPTEVRVTVSREAVTRYPELIGQTVMVPATISPERRLAWIESLHEEQLALEDAERLRAEREAATLGDRIEQVQRSDQVQALAQRLEVLESGGSVNYQELAATSSSLMSALANASVLIGSLQQAGASSVPVLSHLEAQLANARREAQSIASELEQAQQDRDAALRLADSLRQLVSGSNERTAQLVTEAETNYARATAQLNSLVEQLHEHDLQIRRAAIVSEGYEAALEALRQEAAQQTRDAVLAGLSVMATALGLDAEGINAAINRIELAPQSGALFDEARLAMVLAAIRGRQELEARTSQQSARSVLRATPGSGTY